MAQEIECKLRVTSHDLVRERLRRLHAKPRGAVLEVNHLLDQPDGALRTANCALRIRECRAVPDHAARTAVITYKGPPVAGPFKSREEIEFDIGNAAAALQVFKKLGFVERLCFEKRRETWRLEQCHVELDEVPHLGHFVEVEGPDDESVSRVICQLDLDARTQERRAYAGLLDEYCRTNRLNPLSIRF